MVISGADGKVVVSRALPDSTETYASPVVYPRKDGKPWVIFGTGGESLTGAEYRAPLAALLGGDFTARIERLVPTGTKGVIAPPTVVDLNADGELDIVVSTFDGRLVAIDGATGRALWQHADPKEESYHSAAVVRLGPTQLGLFVSRGIGAFPKYVGTAHRLYDAADGRIIYEYRDPNFPGGAPIAVDLTSDGVDEVLFFSIRFPAAQGARVHVLHAPSRTLRTHDMTSTLFSTPAVADLRRTGTLELIAPSWTMDTQGGTPEHPGYTWQLDRLDLSAKTPAFLSWAGYMGTTTDGRYRVPDIAK
jgi:hypothetical protein